MLRVVNLSLLAAILGAVPAVAASPLKSDPEPVQVERKGAVTMFRLPRAGLPPFGVAPDRDGRVWITFEKPAPTEGKAAGQPADEDRKRVGLLDPGQGTVAYLPVPVIPFLPRVAPDGAIWLTEYSPGGAGSGAASPARLARRDPASGEWKVFSTPEKSHGSAMVAFDGAGKAWFSELDTGRVGRVDPRTGEVKEFSLGRGSLPLGISVDKAGGVWTTGTLVGQQGADTLGGASGRVMRLDPEKGAWDEFPIVQGYFAIDLVTDPQRGVWVTGLGRALVALVDPGSKKVQFWDTLTTEPSATTVRAKGIVLDGRGQVWVAEPEADEVARIVPARSTVMEYALPGENLGVQWLAADGQNNIWFGAPGGQAVGRVASDAPVWTLDPGFAAVGIPAGGQTRGVLRVTNEGRAGDRLALSVIEAPEGVSFTFESATIELAPGKSAEVPFTVRVEERTREDRYTVRFVARGTGVTASRSAEIQVAPAGTAPPAGQPEPVSPVAVGGGLVGGALVVVLLMRLAARRR